MNKMTSVRGSRLQYCLSSSISRLLYRKLLLGQTFEVDKGLVNIFGRHGVIVTLWTLTNVH